MNEIPRRKVLQWGLGAAGVGALAACAPPGPTPDPTTTTKAPPPPPSSTTTSTTTTSTTTTTTTAPPPPPPPTNGRFLVVIDMAGGHDGYSMAIPYTDASYYTRRPNVSVPANQVLPFATGMGLHPNLANVKNHPLALVQGVGHPNPDFSHFEMIRRWWFGDTTGTVFPHYGFLGRICDIIAQPDDAATGVSLGWGPTPALSSASAITLSQDPYSNGQYPSYGDPGMDAAWKAAQQAMSQEDRAEATMLFAGRQGIRTALHFSDLVSAIPPSTVTYPDTGLGAQLAATARLLRAGAGIRIVHVPFGASFDTHENHRSTHDGIMTELDGALSAFLTELEGLDLAKNVLVATQSEFGRRADQNETGLDHGTATMGMFCGAVHPGVFGTAANWKTLDTNGNLKATVMMGEYQATMANWLGVSPGDVLSGAPTPLAGVTL